MRVHPMLVVSRDPRTQDAYVLMLRNRRIAVLGVATCGDAVTMRRHIQLAAILVDVASPEDWVACRLLRRACHASVIAVTRVSSDIDCAAARRHSGCVATIAARRGHAAIIRLVNTVLGRIPRLQTSGRPDAARMSPRAISGRSPQSSAG